MARHGRAGRSPDGQALIRFPGMETWDLASLDVQPHQPEVLRSDPEARVIAINLPGGRGAPGAPGPRARLDGGGGRRGGGRAGRRTVSGGCGFVAHFDPKERHEVRATSDARADPAPRPVAGRGAPEPALASGADGPLAQAQAAAGRGAHGRRPARRPRSSTRASAPPPRPASRASSSPGKSYELTGKVVKGSVQHDGRRPALPHPRPRRHRVRAGHLHGRRARPVPRGPRGDRLRASSRTARSWPSATRSSRSARRSSPRTSRRADVAGVGSACLAVALLTALYAVGASVYGARSGRREWVTSGRRAIYCVAALCVVAFGAARGGLPALGLLVRAGGRGLLDRHADLLQGHRAVGDPGRVAAPVGHAAVAVRERGAVPHAPLAARHRALRDRRARRASPPSSCC